ncbi:MAG: hypothetical protein AB7E12_00010 [Burkholderiaceae bacterium]
MTPDEHKNAIMGALLRCCRAYGTSASGGAITGFEQHLDELVRMYTACLAHNDMQNAQIQLLKRDLEEAHRIIELRTAVNKVLESEVHELTAQMEAIGAGGVDGRRITGGAE